MSQLTIQQAFDVALRHHQAGRFSESERLYRQILAEQPEHAGAMHYLGVICNQSGRGDIAVDLIRRSIALNPNDAAAHNNLGNVLREKGRFDEAIAACRQAIVLRPNNAEAYNNLSIALREKGEFEQAIAACRQAIALNSNLPEAHFNLGVTHRMNGQLDEAIAAHRQAVALRPNYAEAHNNLGIALSAKGRLDEAISAYRQAIAVKPNYPQAYSNLGAVLRDMGQLDESIAAFRTAIALRPNYAEAHSNLGTALRDRGRLDEAIAAYRQAIAFDSNYAMAHINLGSALRAKGQLDEAIAAFRQAITVDPNSAEAHSNLVFALYYHSGYRAGTISEELRRWNRQHAEPLRKFIPAHINDRDPDRRLRIGYVSPDFRNHPVGRNLLPLLQFHDRRLFDITCYAQVLHPDAITRQFQQYAQEWRNIVGLSDEQVAGQIQEDRIDILIDLALHTAGNRLLVFARKPAPVQATFGGYPAGTGLDAIDHRLTDPFLDPPGESDSHYREKSLRLPNSFWCYDPGAMEAPAEPVDPIPALENGFITFGCLNNFCKVNDAVLELWAKVMRQLPRSHMKLLAPAGSARQRIEGKLQREQIAAERLVWIDHQPRDQYLQAYRGIDLGLDTFPYNGHTTTCDALWMGVPVVTLCGETAVGRGGRSILSNLGLPELIALTPDQFVTIAIGLANDLDRLKSLRDGLRARMLASPLTDAEGFARGIESAYRQMWRTWCQTSAARS